MSESKKFMSQENLELYDGLIKTYIDEKDVASNISFTPTDRVNKNNVQEAIAFVADNGEKSRILTREQYDALTDAEKNNGTTYYITDDGGATDAPNAYNIEYDADSVGFNAVNVQDGIDKLYLNTYTLDTPRTADRIPSSADLNTYTTPGTYVCPNQATAETLTNCPVAWAFKLQVDKLYTFYRQTITMGNSKGATIYTRSTNSNNDGWGDWKTIATTGDLSDYLKMPYSLITSGDLDTFTTNGAFVWYYGNYQNITNVPSDFGSVGGHLIVMKDGDVTIQAISKRSGSSTITVYGDMWLRFRLGTYPWSAWKKLATSGYTAVTDCNNATEINTVYYGNNTTANMPVANSYMFITAYQLSSTIITQMAYQVNSSSDCIWTRRCVNGTWQSWQRLATSTDLAKNNLFENATYTIAANTDLNTLVTPGTYYCENSANSKTLTNRPSGIPDCGFRMNVLMGKYYNDTNYWIKQEITILANKSNRTYVRVLNAYNSGTWGGWSTTALLDDLYYQKGSTYSTTMSYVLPCWVSSGTLYVEIPLDKPIASGLNATCTVSEMLFAGVNAAYTWKSTDVITCSIGGPRDSVRLNITCTHGLTATRACSAFAKLTLTFN